MSQILCLIFIVLGISLAREIDLTKVYDQAEASLEAKLKFEMERGMTSSRQSKKKFTEFSREMANRNSIFRAALNDLEQNYELNKDEALKLARQALSENRNIKHYGPGGQTGKTYPVGVMADACLGTTPTCDPDSPFRTISGVCNNLKKPFQGAMSTPFAREIPVGEYDPKVDLTIYLDLLQTSQMGNFTNSRILPGARTVSNNFHTDMDVPSDVATTMVMQMGQFLDHDITLTPEHEEHDCCDEEFDNENCYAIPVSLNDPFYGPRGVHCLEFTRSVAFCEENGGPRELVNAITSYIDASNVYGSDDETAGLLRSYVDGKLKTGEYNLLPVIDGEPMAGDVRALDMPGLATMHTLFMREHNRICDLIKTEHSDWSDEEIYQNARRILIAEYQSVIFGQYLPVVLGEDNMNGLKLKKKGSKYKKNVDATMTTEFATAAYRFGHSLLQGVIQMFATDNSGQVDQYALHEGLFNPERYYMNNGQGMEQILMGLLNQRAQTFDRKVTTEVTNLLFVEIGDDFGTDLVSRNIHRGRDHGIPSFCYYYKLYDDPDADCSKGWEVRYNGIDEESWAQLKKIYLHPSDIDLFTGGFAQAPFNGGLTGKVFNSMKVNQWRKSLRGDRFFFTHKGQAGSFTKPARKTLIQRTLAGIICDNTEITHVPINVFKPTDSNDFISCNEAPALGDINILLEMPQGSDDEGSDDDDEDDIDEDEIAIKGY